MENLEKLWISCKDWLIEFDGSASEAYLCNIQPDNCEKALEAIKMNCQNFNVELCWKEEKSEENTTDELKDIISNLENGKLTNFVINLTTTFEKDKIPFTLIVDRINLEDTFFDINIVWWSDQIFKNQKSQYGRFKILMNYLFQLKEQFQAQELYVAPENSSRPTQNKYDDWKKIEGINGKDSRRFS